MSELAFGVVRHDHKSSDSQNQISLLENSLIDFLVEGFLRFERDKAYYTVQPITASHLVLKALGDVTDSYFISHLGFQINTK